MGNHLNKHKTLKMRFWWTKRKPKGDISYKRLPSLDTIRVVKFKPGTSKHPIRVKLKTININTTRYAALSYTWELDERISSYDGLKYGYSGDEETCTILCNRTVVYINKNLYEALKQLRELSSDVPIFVDRLCINFDSREERAAQTSMMGHIYAKASAVVVWVGKKTAHSNETVRIMRKLVNALDWRKLPRDFRFDFRDSTAYQNLGIDRITLSQWKHVFAFCDATWFSRLWPFYELVNAREATFLYGDCWMDYDFVMDFAMVLRLTGWLDGASDLALGRMASDSNLDQAFYKGAGSNYGSNNYSNNNNHSSHRSDSSVQGSKRYSTTSFDHLVPPGESVGLTTMFAPVATLRTIPTWHPKHIEYERVMRMEHGLRTESERAWKFLELLLQTSEGFECSDPRDRILAPLAYARRVFQGQGLNKDWPVVDYGTSVETMYAHFAHLIYKNTGQPSILATTNISHAPPVMPRAKGRPKQRMPID